MPTAMLLPLESGPTSPGGFNTDITDAELLQTIADSTDATIFTYGHNMEALE